MTILYAQPYDITATGFYFETAEQYDALAEKVRNDYCQPVEELEIQFIDGEALDAELAEAWGLNQSTFAAFLDAAAKWDEHSKIRLIIAMREGIGFNIGSDDIDALDVDIYGVETMQELAEQFVDDGLFGDIPEALRGYIDYETIARDLAIDYSETAIAGERFIYRCG